MTMQPPEGERAAARDDLEVRRELRDVGEAHIRTQIEESYARLELEAFSEEVQVEHEPVGDVVSERQDPYQEGDDLIVPVYEEQLVVSRRLILRERLRVKRIKTTQVQLFEDRLRRDRVHIDDPQHTGMVRERFSDGQPEKLVETSDLDSDPSEPTATETGAPAPSGGEESSAADTAQRSGS
jgi:uncharacterized protein (TIGR02271 family)